MSFPVLSLTVLFVLQQVVPIDTYEFVAAAWYTGWDPCQLSSVSWDTYNTLFYSFAITTPSVNSLSLDGSDPSLLPEFVSEAHKHGVAAHVAVGGWTGGVYFSSNLATPQNRTAFVKTCVDFAEKYDLDGLNFDWEYPNNQGIGHNTINKDDTENFLSFLREIRADPVGAKLTLTAATSITPFCGASGNPTKDVSAFADVLDYIVIMNYDVWGPWSPAVGPNAPLSDTCAPLAYQEGSAVSAVNAWTTAGMPVNMIVLGVPSYGHSYSVSQSHALPDGGRSGLASFPKFNALDEPFGNAWGDVGDIGACEDYGGSAGTLTFRGLVANGFLNTEGNPVQGIYYRYDSCSQTPYVYDSASGVMVSFDDARSFSAKGNYIKNTGLRGFAMWETGGDYHNILLDSISRAAGFKR